ncbi:hypothetical protein ACVMVB_19805, partial [Stenotrophomonas maltophilia]
STSAIFRGLPARYRSLPPDISHPCTGTLFSPERVNHIMVLGMSYPSLLATLEASAYMAFGVMPVMRLLGGPEPELSAGVGPGR